MASVYDRIKTAKELVHEAMTCGFSTKQEDICRAQDIFGRSTNEELIALANDIGRNDENGNPDPNGTWSSGRRGTRDTFYSILFQIWSWEQATSFWNQHSNPEYKKYIDVRNECKYLKQENEQMAGQYKQEHEARLKETSARLEAEGKAQKLEAELHDRDMTILELKAKLYDLMMKEGDK